MKYGILSTLIGATFLWATAGCKKHPTESGQLESRAFIFLDGTSPVSGWAVLFQRDPWLGGLTGMGQRHALDTVGIEQGIVHWPTEMPVAEVDITAQHTNGLVVQRDHVSAWEGVGSNISLPTPFRLTMKLERPLPFTGKLHVRQTESTAMPTLADWVNSGPITDWMDIESNALPLPLTLDMLFPSSADTLFLRLHWFEQSIENGIVPLANQALQIPVERLSNPVVYPINF